MKNYTYGWVLRDRGYREIPESEYTEAMLDMKKFIDMLSNVVKQAKCGWDSVEYKVMNHPFGGHEVYMVLCVDNRGERYIPITGNSKGCNLEVIGQNLF